MNFDVFGMLRRNLRATSEDALAKEDYPSNTLGGQLVNRVVPQTLSEIIDLQIKHHETEIKKLKEAKEAISPEVERALNALARL